MGGGMLASFVPEDGTLNLNDLLSNVLDPKAKNYNTYLFTLSYMANV